jgi:[ribosomal protein S18]-alanine N-acetyltransferase
MTTEIDIRLAIRADIDAIAALYGEAFDPMQPRMSVEQYLTPPGAFALIAHIDNNDSRNPAPAGFLIGRVVLDESEIFSVGVANEFRRRGVARALVETLCALAAARGAHAVFLEVAVDNPGATALYRDSGFDIVGRRENYYRDPGGNRIDALVMKCAVKTEN